MKILFFVSSMHAGGAERVAATLATAWAARGDTVTLAPTFTKKGQLFYRLGRSVKLVWLADRMGWLGKTRLAGLRKLFAIRRLVKETQPDVIVSFLTNVNVMVLLAAGRMGVPIIVCERTNPAVSTSAGRRLPALRRYTYPQATIVTLQSQDSVQAFANMVPGIRELAVIPNPLPPELLNAPRTRVAKTPTARYRLVAMGRLVDFKRFDALIGVFAQLAAQYPEWDLYIWGEGPSRPQLLTVIQDAGLEARVFLPGRTDDPWTELAAGDIFVLTSQVEGFPNVLLEAMALGLPCVTVDCPSGPREMSRDGQDALLVPVDDQAALQNALVQLMGDPALRDVLGRHAAASVSSRYGLPEVLALWDALFDRAQAAVRRKEHKP